MLTCSKCGTVSPRPAPFCSVCGTSLTSGGVMPAIPPPPIGTKTSAFAITGFVLSFVCGVLGLIFSILGYREAKKSDGRITGEGFAIAGIAISIGSMLMAILMWWMLFRVVDSIDTVFDETSVRINLREMARRAEQYKVEHGQFPVRDVAPAGACCSEPRGRCRIDAQAPEWRALRFDPDSWGSERFRYGYRSRPGEFEAIAVGDTDCDGDEVTLTLRIGTDTSREIQRTGTD